MSKKETSLAAAPKRPPVWRAYVLPLLGGTLSMLVALLAFQKTESFLLRDPRFSLRPAEPGFTGSPDLRITGLSRTPAAQVRNVFARDEGGSVFQIPLGERRDELMRIQWVRQASVSRLWPNRIDVRVVERVPQAFIRLPGRRHGGGSISALIDMDGVILPAPETKGHYDLPVLDGVREDQTTAERAARVQRMRQLLGELKETAEKVSEIDAADLSNLKVTLQVEDRVVMLLVGDEQFGKRVGRFMQHWGEIIRRAPNAHLFDLRLEDRITAVEEGSREGE